jgi:hypothetical protein
MCLTDIKPLEPARDVLAYKVFRIGYYKNKYCLLPVYNAYELFNDVNKTYVVTRHKILGYGSDKYEAGYHAHTSKSAAKKESANGLVYAKVEMLRAYVKGSFIFDKAVVAKSFKFVDDRVICTVPDWKLYVCDVVKYQSMYDALFNSSHKFSHTKFKRDIGGKLINQNKKCA